MTNDGRLHGQPSSLVHSIGIERWISRAPPTSSGLGSCRRQREPTDRAQKNRFSQLTAQKSSGAHVSRGGSHQLLTSPGVPGHSAFASLPWLPVLLRTPPAGPLPCPGGCYSAAGARTPCSTAKALAYIAATSKRVWQMKPTSPVSAYSSLSSCTEIPSRMKRVNSE